MLEIRLLGQFDVQLNAEPVEISSRPAQTLLAYLALSAGTAHRREKLAGLLWPDISESSAKTNLRGALWRLRKAIGVDPDFLLTDNLTISIDKDADLWVDVAILQSDASDATSTEKLVEMASLYDGELLPGFYEDWVVLERERLHAENEQKIQLLLDRLVATQRWQEVLHWGERWIAQGQVPDPLIAR